MNGHSATPPTRLLLVRHGNTFAPGDKVTWVGARTDLSLVESGRVQAATLGRKLAELGIAVDGLVLVGPLRRTVEHAALLAANLPGTPAAVATDALREIDYGAWENLSTEEIHALGGADALDAWDKQSVWPLAPGWSPDPQAIAKAATAILDRVAADAAGRLSLVVSSNGILRFFAAAAGVTVTGGLKTPTGGASLLIRDGNQWRVAFWGRKPAEMTSFG